MSKTAAKDTECLLFEATKKQLKITKNDFEEELDELVNDY